MKLSLCLQLRIKCLLSECNLQSDSTAERSQTGCRHILKRKFDNILDKVTGLRIIIFTLVLQVRYVSFGCSTFIIWQLINNTCASKVKCFQLPCICSIYFCMLLQITPLVTYILYNLSHIQLNCISLVAHFCTEYHMLFIQLHD